MVTKEKSGVVVSNKMKKTIVVSVESKYVHTKYGKLLTKTKKYKAHDEFNSCKIGDFVIISETKPLSKTKRWNLKTTKQSLPCPRVSIFGE